MTSPATSALEQERADLERTQGLRAQGYWAIVRTQFRKNRTGMVGLWMVLSIVAVAMLAPLLANDRPVVAGYRGSLCFPAFTTYVDAWVFWPSARSALKSWKVGDALPLGDHYEILEGRSWAEAIEAAEAAGGSELGVVVWPPVRWSPRQIDKGARMAEFDLVK